MLQKLSADGDKAYLFLHHALNILSHQTVSSLRNLFGNQLVYGKDESKITKIS